MVHVSGVMMVKNEKKRIHVTLDSLKGFVKSLVIYDTGSTDNTLDIIREFSKKNNIPVNIKEGEFVNFEVSRNVLLDFAEEIEEIDYFLLLDCNDELRGGEKLLTFCEKFLNNNSITAFLLCQQWFSGEMTKYYNMRLIKNGKGWRYKSPVHEYLEDRTKKEGEPDKVFRFPDEICLYQDRTKDDDKTSKRFHRDREILTEEYEKDPTNARTVFYLAQTYNCLGDKENAYKYYNIRKDMKGFWEEVFQSNMKCGELAGALKKPWETSLGYFMKAAESCDRAEPFVSIAIHYKNMADKFPEKKIHYLKMSYMFASRACKFEFPHQCILFIDRFAYDYKRWHLLGIVAYYEKAYEEGKNACQMALKSRKESEIDVHNLRFYVEKIVEIEKAKK